MGTSGWRSRRSVIEQVALEAWRFDFHQAVHLIETLRPEARSVGEGSSTEHEALRFRSSLASTFPASDLAGVRPSHPGQPHWELDVNFMGLAGAFGPLPAPFTETIVRHARMGDTASRDFLDIFNHRLISLFYRVRRQHRPELSRQSPDQGGLARILYALMGLGTGNLRERMAVPDRALLHYTGLLDQQPRSLHGLERLLCCHFDLPVRVRPLQGRWLPLDDTQTTRLGRRNSRLGEGLVLGSRVWDQQAALRVELGPLDGQSFLAFLPDGRSWPELQAMIEFYAQDDVVVDVRLRLKAGEVGATRLEGANRVSLHTSRGLAARPRANAARLGAVAPRLVTRPGPTAPRLGWTTWLTTRPRTEDGVVTVRGRLS
jgi:type VI secretion system protein ImpH